MVEDGVFYEYMDPKLRQILDDRLGTDYRLVRHYRFNMIHKHYPFEKFVMNSAAPAFLYELRKEGEPAGPRPEDAGAGLPDPSK